jgi:DNA-binding protein Fis
MLIDEATSRYKGAAGAKEIKVKIPLDYHIKLHTLKVLKGQSISDTVERALEKYFQDFTGEERDAYNAVTSRAMSAFTH